MSQIGRKIMLAFDLLGKYLKQDVSVMAMVLSIVRLATRKQENVLANLNFLV